MPNQVRNSQGLIWLFDLDNTLHDASKEIFKAINTGMRQAVQTIVGCDVQTADKLRVKYWHRYGATVIGMEKHHNANAQEFLRLSHDFHVPSMVHSESNIVNNISALPGRKILLTNAPYSYAKQVLQTLDLHPCFESLWAIDHMRLQGRLRPKPSLMLMKQVLARLKVPSNQVILVEDTLKNLKTAHQIGMKTVHMYHPETPFTNKNKGRPSYVDIRVNSIAQLLGTPSAWRTPNSLNHA